MNRFFSRIKDSFNSLKGKTVLGFLSIVAILFFPLALSITQFLTMDNYVTGEIKDDIREIQNLDSLMNMVSDYNLRILSHIGDDEVTNLPTFDQQSFIDAIDGLQQKLIDGHAEHAHGARHIRQRASDNKADETHSSLMDTVLYAYSAYLFITKEFKDVVLSDFINTKGWYLMRMQPAYKRLISAMTRLSESICDDLDHQYEVYSNWHQKSMLLVVISVGACIILTLMMLYFYLQFFVNPVIRMSRHITEFRSAGKKYTYQLDDDKDRQDQNGELYKINSALVELSEDNHTLRRRVKGLRATLAHKEDGEDNQ